MLKVKSFAKLNLGLHIISKKMPNNHYPIRFINCQINLYDDIIFENINSQVEFKSNNPNIQKNKNNLIVRAVDLIKDYSKNKNLGVKIKLNKKIPFTGGFSGGSSNAAATLKATSKLWGLKIPKKKYFEFADKLGRDVFYSLIGGLCEVGGDGNIVRKLRYDLPRLWLVVVVPKQMKPSTAWMYQNIDSDKVGKSLKKFQNLKSAIKNKNMNQIFKNLHNDFEFSVEKLYPVIRKIKNDLIENNAARAMIAGSGLSVIGFFDTKKGASAAFKKLQNVYNEILLTYTI